MLPAQTRVDRQPPQCPGVLDVETEVGAHQVVGPGRRVIDKDRVGHAVAIALQEVRVGVGRVPGLADVALHACLECVRAGHVGRRSDHHVAEVVGAGLRRARRRERAARDVHAPGIGVPLGRERNPLDTGLILLGVRVHARAVTRVDEQPASEIRGPLGSGRVPDHRRPSPRSGRHVDA